MTLSQLRYAITVADSRSMNRGGAEIVYLSQAFRRLSGNWKTRLESRFSGEPTAGSGDTGRRRICRICQTGRGTVCPDRGTVCG